MFFRPRQIVETIFVANLCAHVLYYVSVCLHASLASFFFYFFSWQKRSPLLFSVIFICQWSDGNSSCQCCFHISVPKVGFEVIQGLRFQGQLHSLLCKKNISFDKMEGKFTNL